MLINEQFAYINCFKMKMRSREFLKWIYIWNVLNNQMMNFFPGTLWAIWWADTECGSFRADTLTKMPKITRAADFSGCGRTAGVEKRIRERKLVQNEAPNVPRAHLTAKLIISRIGSLSYICIICISIIIKIIISYNPNHLFPYCFFCVKVIFSILLLLILLFF